MKVDFQELAAVAQTATPRLDLYAGIHKAIRSAMCDSLLALGQLDVQDAGELTALAQRLQVLLFFCRQHVAHENEFLHPLLETRAGGSSLTVAAEHVEHLRHIDALARGLAQLQAAPAASRPVLAHALYLELALFIAENLHHMHQEETAHNPVLWQHFNDAELADCHQRLLASIPPPELMDALRWMVPAMNPTERLHMLMGMREQAPPEAFAAVLQTVRPHLSDKAWQQLAQGLGLEA